MSTANQAAPEPIQGRTIRKNSCCTGRQNRTNVVRSYSTMKVGSWSKPVGLVNGYEQI